MYNTDYIREMLIDTYHSNDAATQYFEKRLQDKYLLDLLVKIALDEEDIGGDAPMAAGDFIYKFPSEWLKKYEREFIEVLQRDYSSVRPEDIAMALAKIKSQEAKIIIEQQIKGLEFGSRCDNFRTALQMYKTT